MQLLTVLFQSLAMSFATRLPLSAGLIMIESSLSASNLHCLQAQAELILLAKLDVILFTPNAVTRVQLF